MKIITIYGYIEYAQLECGECKDWRYGAPASYSAWEIGLIVAALMGAGVKFSVIG